MKGFLLGCGALIAVFFAVVVGGILWYFSIVNGEVRLRNRAAAVQKANELVFDNMVKTIAQTTEAADDHKADFQEGWKSILEAQNSGQRSGMVNVVINRMNPNLDSSLRKKVQAVVETTRREFLTNQEDLLDIKRQHDDMRTTAPSSWFVGSVAPLKVIVVSSTRAGDAFEAGRDDDTSLRGRKVEAPAQKAPEKAPAPAIEQKK